LIRDLEDEKALLSKDLAFYKSILAPEDATEGVRLHVFDLLPGASKNEYQLRLVISQIARDNPFIKGSLTVNVQGTWKGKKETLSLLDLAGMDKSQALGFRYFQSFPDSRDYVSFKLPDGFNPEKIEVGIKVRNNGVRSVNQTYDWYQTLAKGRDQEVE
jgi:hypothetical protein